MVGLLVVVAGIVVLGLIVWANVEHRAIAVELASRSEQEYNVAGLRKADEVGRHAWFGTGVFRIRRLRRRLDDAAATIARFEADQADQADQADGGRRRRDPD